MKTILTLIILFTFTLLLSCSSNSKNEEISKYKLAVITASNTYDFEIATKNLDSLKNLDSENVTLIDSLNKVIKSKQDIYNSFSGEYSYGMNEYYLDILLNPNQKAIKITQGIAGTSDKEEITGEYKMEGDSILKVKWSNDIHTYDYKNSNEFGGNKSKNKKAIGDIRVDPRFNTLQIINLQIFPNELITLKNQNN